MIFGIDLDSDKALDHLSDATLDFELRGFTRKDNVPPKAQHVFASAIFKKNVQDMNVKFEMTTRQKIVFSCL